MKRGVPSSRLPGAGPLVLWESSERVQSWGIFMLRVEDLGGSADEVPWYWEPSSDPSDLASRGDMKVFERQAVHELC